MTARRVAIAAFIVVVFAMAFVLEGYVLYRFTLAGAYAMAILGINLLTGLSGQFSIGHSAFFAIGAYTTALVLQGSGLGPYIGLASAGLVAFVAGFLFGWPALRLSMVHLALTTWGLALAVPQLLKSRYLEPLTGGVQGVYLDRPPAPFGLALSDDQWWHLVLAATLLVMIWLAGNLMHSRTGRALIAIRDNEIAAAPMGINVAIYKTLIFGVSAALAGIAGGFVALLTDFVAPDSYTFMFGVMLMVGAVAGGLQSVWGAVFGGLFVQFLPDLASSASSVLSLPAQGFVLLALIYLLPAGMSGAVVRWLPFMRRPRD
ncbi:MAG: branched-chain amino acid ABC transporter permease [Pseudomonadota bacterium]